MRSAGRSTRAQERRRTRTRTGESGMVILFRSFASLARRKLSMKHQPGNITVMPEASPDHAEPLSAVIGSAIYDVDVSDPTGELVDRGALAPDEVRQISGVMQALGGLRDAEQKLSEASLRYMKLNQTDMRALHFLIACANRGVTATPGAIAVHLGISTASTTKL